MKNTEHNAALWTVTLAATAVLGTLVTACMMPFVAVATIAATTMDRRQATIAVLGAWAANQLLGFGLLGYPLTGYALVWGAALGGAGLATLPIVARIDDGSLSRLIVAFVAAFALWEALLFVLALAVGGLETFTPSIVLKLFANELLWLAVLVGVHLVATRFAPRVFGNPRLVRLG